MIFYSYMFVHQRVYQISGRQRNLAVPGSLIFSEMFRCETRCGTGNGASCNSMSTITCSAGLMKAMKSSKVGKDIVSGVLSSTLAFQHVARSTLCKESCKSRGERPVECLAKTSRSFSLRHRAFRSQKARHCSIRKPVDCFL